MKDEKREAARKKFKIKFGRRLRAVREDLKLSKADMSTKLGLHYVQYVGYEAGRKIPQVFTLIKLCRVLNLSADSLLGLDIKEQENSVE